MTNWQDKYKDLEVGQSAWYWHKSDIGGKLCQYPVQVHIWRSMQDGRNILWGESLRESRGVSETFPNGPKCLTPDDVIEITQKLANMVEKKKFVGELK
jgi:hypothetical protein